MSVSGKYLVAVALLAVLAVGFGLAGTVAPPLAEPGTVAPQQESSSGSVGHFQNPPTYDSGWVDISDRAGDYVDLKHNLNTTQLVVDITGKQSLDPMGGALAWKRTYGGTSGDYAHSMIQTRDGGYALAGDTWSYGAGNFDFWLVKTDAAGNALWNRTYGGTGEDEVRFVIQTNDGGYALAGYTKSYGAGDRDFWLVKTDGSGNLQWNKTYGGIGGETAYSVIQTADGGYALAGDTNSYGAGSFDFWLVKTDSSGTKQWNKTYGGAGWDQAFSVVQTGDGGYAIAGLTASFGAVLYDFLLVKTDASGTMQWNKIYGGAGYDDAFSVVQMSDGGYALAGYTDSFGAGGGDFWLVRTNSAGTMLWSKTYGGASEEFAYSLVQTRDGGYALAGHTRSYGAEDADFWLIKVKAEMNLEHQRHLGGTGVNVGWSQTYGGTSDDSAYSLVQTWDGGYAIAGSTYSYGVGTPTYSNFWVVKTDSAGVKQWNKTYGGTGEDVAYSLVQTWDGGYAIAGAGGGDFWLVKTDSAGNIQWNQTYGGTGGDVAYSLVQTSDGGYALAGYTTSYGVGDYDFWLVKTDSAGNIQWNQTYGGTSDDYALSVVQTSDGGYALAGYTTSYGVGDYDFWLVKTDSAGNVLWSQIYGGTSDDYALSVVQTGDGGYALAGFTWSYGAGSSDFWLVKTDSAGNVLWSKTYGGTGIDVARSVVQTGDWGYALAGITISFGAGSSDFWLVKTDSAGNVLWSKTYGGTHSDFAYSLIQTGDWGYALAGITISYGAGGRDFWLVKSDIELGLAMTGLTTNSIVFYRGKTDPYWNYVRIRIWIIKEPSWIYGDINMDGIVDAKDLYILGRNYGKSFSLLSLSGIIAIAGIHTVKKRKQSKQPEQRSYIS